MKDVLRETYDQFEKDMDTWFHTMIDCSCMIDGYKLTPDEFPDETLMHVTFLFAQVLMNKMYFTPEGQREISFEERCKLVNEAGKDIRELVKKYALKDPHELKF